MGTIGLGTCSATFGDSLAIGHILARLGSQMILSPSVWAVNADNVPRVLRQAPADSDIELSQIYDVTVIGVGEVRWLKTRAAVGSTAFISIAQHPECLDIATADPRSLPFGLIGRALELCSPRGERQATLPAGLPLDLKQA